MLHKQEALFLSVTVGLFVLYVFVTRFGSCVKGSSLPVSAKRVLCVSGFLTIFLTPLVLLLLSDLFVIPPGNIGASPLSNNTIVISGIFTGSLPLVISDPIGRVYETVGLWGFYVLFLYFVALDKASRILALTILSIAPFLLVFNPLFTHPFLNYASPDVLWRFFYMIPIGLVGAHVFIVLMRSWLSSKKSLSLTYIVLLVVFLIPVDAIQHIQNSRLSTLRKIETKNSVEFWMDAVDQLNTYGDRHLLTDPVTRYILRALTDLDSAGFKFHDSPPYVPINYNGYQDLSFRGYKGWVFVANYRDGLPSGNGLMSGHWPKDVLLMRKYYSDDLQKFLASPPDHFQLDWENDAIRIFRILDQR